MTIEVERPSVGLLLKNSKFTIPVYQRLYSWGEDNWSDLLQSIQDNFKSNSDYFLGSIITKNKTNTTDIVDGQQRLTTISILLSVLKKKIKDENYKKAISECLYDTDRKTKEEIFRLNHLDVDKKNFTTIVKNDYEINNDDSQSQLIKAYKYFYNNLYHNNEELDGKIDKIYSQDELKEICDFILEKCIFVRIHLSYDESEQTIFNTMNSTGLSLSTLDLLKNWILGNKEEQNNYLDRWISVFEEDENIINFWSNKISKNNTNADLILYSVMLFLETKANNYSSYHGYTTYGKLYSVYRNKVEKEKLFKKEDIIKDIFFLAEKFYDLQKRKEINNEITINDKLNILLLSMERTQVTAFYVIILYIECKMEATDEVKNTLYSYLINISVLNNLLNAGSNWINKFISTLIHKIQTAKNNNDFLYYIEERIKKIILDSIPLSNNALDSKDSFIKKVANKSFYRLNKTYNAVLPLCIVEIYLRGKNPDQKFKYQSNWDLEHIIAKKSESGKLLDNHILNALGNLTLLNSSTNRGEKNNPVEDKYIIYSSSTMNINRNIEHFFQSKPREEAINQRGKSVAEELYNALGLKNILEK